MCSDDADDNRDSDEVNSEDEDDKDEEEEEVDREEEKEGNGIDPYASSIMWLSESNRLK